MRDGRIEVAWDRGSGPRKKRVGSYEIWNLLQLGKIRALEYLNLERLSRVLCGLPNVPGTFVLSGRLTNLYRFVLDCGRPTRMRKVVFEPGLSSLRHVILRGDVDDGAPPFEVDFRGGTEVPYLDCCGLGIRTINWAPFSSLRVLKLVGTNLSEIEFPNMPGVEIINLSFSLIAQIKFVGNRFPALRYFGAVGCPLGDFALPPGCDVSRLKILDLSGCASLKGVFVPNGCMINVKCHIRLTACASLQNVNFWDVMTQWHGRTQLLRESLREIPQGEQKPRQVEWRPRPPGVYISDHAAPFFSVSMGGCPMLRQNPREIPGTVFTDGADVQEHYLSFYTHPEENYQSRRLEERCAEAYKGGAEAERRDDAKMELYRKLSTSDMIGRHDVR
jgi:hypothetical protein